VALVILGKTCYILTACATPLLLIFMPIWLPSLPMIGYNARGGKTGE